MKKIIIGFSIILTFVLIGILIKTAGKNVKIETGGFKSAKDLIAQGKLSEANTELERLKNEQPENTKPLGATYLLLAQAYEKKGMLVEARDAYQMVVKFSPDISSIADVQKKLGKLNTNILFSPIVTAKDVQYEVRPGDTLYKISKRFNTTVELIKRSNALTSDTIKANSKLKIINQRFNIIIDKSQNTLTLMSGDEVIKIYTVSTGENNTTPIGTFQIINKIVDPVWYTQGAIVPSDSPKNILGSRWMGFSIPGYGLHGTIEPESVGKQATKGCIRMLNQDVEELFTIVPTGTEVTIVD